MIACPDRGAVIDGPCRVLPWGGRHGVTGSSRGRMLLFLGCLAAPEVPERTVIIAAGDLYPGIPIAAADLAAVPMPIGIGPDAAMTDPERIIGRMTFERILANEPILEDRLTDPS